MAATLDLPRRMKPNASLRAGLATLSRDRSVLPARVSRKRPKGR